ISWQHVRISGFGGPEVLELAEESTIPNPGPGEVRIKVLAAGTGFTDSFIRRGRYPNFKGPLPFTPGYELVGVVEKAGSGVVAPREGQIVADLCVVGGYAQYAIRPAHFLVPVPDGLDAAEAVCIPLAYLTAFQMLTRCCRLSPGEMILVIGASGTVGTAMLDLARHFGLKAIGTCSAANLATVERFGATAIDYRAGDFVASVRELTAGRAGGAGVDAEFDAIGGSHFGRSFACLAPGGILMRICGPSPIHEHHSTTPAPPAYPRALRREGPGRSPGSSSRDPGPAGARVLPDFKGNDYLSVWCAKWLLHQHNLKAYPAMAGEVTTGLCRANAG